VRRALLSLLLGLGVAAIASSGQQLFKVQARHEVVGLAAGTVLAPLKTGSATKTVAPQREADTKRGLDRVRSALGGAWGRLGAFFRRRDARRAELSADEAELLRASFERQFMTPAVFSTAQESALDGLTEADTTETVAPNAEVSEEVKITPTVEASETLQNGLATVDSETNQALLEKSLGLADPTVETVVEAPLQETVQQRLAMNATLIDDMAVLRSRMDEVRQAERARILGGVNPMRHVLSMLSKIPNVSRVREPIVHAPMRSPERVELPIPVLREMLGRAGVAVPAR
jgi:hypothetical protein